MSFASVTFKTKFLFVILHLHYFFFLVSQNFIHFRYEGICYFLCFILQFFHQIFTEVFFFFKFFKFFVCLPPVIPYGYLSFLSLFLYNFDELFSSFFCKR